VPGGFGIPAMLSGSDSAGFIGIPNYLSSNGGRNVNLDGETHDRTESEATAREMSQNQAAVELLRQAAEYVENRIALVDSKSAIMLTAVAAVFAALVFAAGDLPEVDAVISVAAGVYALLGVALLLGGISVAFLLQAIRHSRWFLGMSVPIEKHDVSPYFMWPSGEFPGTFADFVSKSCKITSQTAFDNWAATSYVALQLVRIKYKNYRRAMLFVKLLGAWSAFSIIVLGIWRATGEI